MNQHSRFKPYAWKFSTALWLTLILAFSSTGGAAQSAPEPRREQLLNGLRLLLWHRPSDPEVMLKLRVHSGAAFDLAGRGGTMALLADSLFPDPATREYFTEELGGRLEVTSDYDAINVTMTARASEFERLVELLRGALTGAAPAPEVVTNLREARTRLVRELSVSPAIVADRAVAARLFGEFPYGRQSAGAPDSLARVQRADLMLARERFVNPNNATLVVAGGVDEKRVLRAARQLLGNWRKSETIAPATFRQPEAPDARTLLLDVPGAAAAEVRLATRALSRSDADYFAATLLALLARDRWQAALPELGRSAFFVRHEGRLLPGMFVMGATVKPADAARALASARAALEALASAPPSAAELERVKTEAVAEFNRRLEQPATLVDSWLDAETYRLGPVSEQAVALSRVSPADVQRVAAKLFRAKPLASVAVGGAAQLGAEMRKAGLSVETASLPADAQPAAPASTSPAAKTPATVAPAAKPPVKTP